MKTGSNEERKKGRKDGMEKGRKDGMKEGRNKGRNKGRNGEMKRKERKKKLGMRGYEHQNVAKTGHIGDSSANMLQTGSQTEPDKKKKTNHRQVLPRINCRKVEKTSRRNKRPASNTQQPAMILQTFSS